VIICDCFVGDNRAIALAQHDLNFGRELEPSQLFHPGNTTLWHIWSMALSRAEGAARQGDTWFATHYRRLSRIDRFSHKTLQPAHEHIAAFYRWTVRGVQPPAFAARGPRYLRLYWLSQWRSYLNHELPDLLAQPGVLTAICRTVLYRHFDTADKSAAELDQLLINRYGLDCVAKTWRLDPERRRMMGLAA
jgi:hypothetical protein